MPRSRQVEYRAFRRGRRCPLCRGRRKSSVGVLCRVCSAKHNAAQNARYHERKQLSLCDWCRGPSDGKTYCKLCSERRKRQPSRDGRNPRVRAQRKRWRLAAKRRQQVAT